MSFLTSLLKNCQQLLSKDFYSANNLLITQGLSDNETLKEFAEMWLFAHEQEAKLFLLLKSHFNELVECAQKQEKKSLQQSLDPGA